MKSALNVVVAVVVVAVVVVGGGWVFVRRVDGGVPRTSVDKCVESNSVGSYFVYFSHFVKYFECII